MNYYSVLILLSIPLHLQGQDYVVTNDGDTLKGEIRRPTIEHLLYQKVVFKSGNKTVFHPKDLRAYRLGNDIFETHDVVEPRSGKVFLKPVVSGYCTLYEYQYLSTLYSGDGTVTTSESLQVYYLKRPGEELHVYKFASLRNGKDLYFFDNPLLTSDLQSGKYKKRDIHKIVVRYNNDQKSN